MKLTERINFRQPKYMLPAIVYLPLLGASYFIFDLFDTKVAEKKDANMQTTEYLNPNLPQAHIKGGDGIGGKYENMLNAYGKIEDHSAVENIDRDNEQEKVAKIPTLISSSTIELWAFVPIPIFSSFTAVPKPLPKMQSAGFANIVSHISNLPLDIVFAMFSDFSRDFSSCFFIII